MHSPSSSLRAPLAGGVLRCPVLRVCAGDTERVSNSVGNVLSPRLILKGRAGLRARIHFWSLSRSGGGRQWFAFFT